MSLFQNSVLNKYLKALDNEKVERAFELFSAHFHNPVIQENIRNSKEEQYQGEFLIDLFVNVLGYIKNPTPDFNLTTELKNIKGSKKTDGAIIDGKKALAVIELKGTGTADLSKVETQAFGYKNNQPGCNYVITSNFEKLRFYIDNAVDFEEFNLFQLTKERFEVLWLCLSSEYILKDIPKKIKNESLTQEENITRQLYKDYALFRNEIFNSIHSENQQYDKLTLFKKTQKLLDRFLFIFFAEDRLLLPPNSIRSILKQWTDLKEKYDEYFPLYERFRKYFGYLNTGHKGHQHEIFAYNGGLFSPDEILDNIKIDDDLLYKHTLKLSNYDFESEVSVNILGHIFEHSLNDIDEIQAEIQGEVTDKSKSKRKKDGVFYTPKYITKYIVDNTVGTLCEEKKAELDLQEADYEKERKGRKKATLKKLTKKLEDYRSWLLQLTICDPACGSGAFLNQALEFLIAEHGYIDELQAKLFGDAMVMSEVENAILENNIYGVDINGESVEIAKLSLWLRTAQKGRKLTSLNNNIKTGNSLIGDPEVAGEKAFNWQQEFPEVFAKGGFDVVIGNPPYGAFFGNPEKEYIIKNYNSYQYKFESYLYFYEKGVDILKTNGFLSFITPELFLRLDRSEKIREFLYKNTNLLELKFYGEEVFQDVKINSVVLTLEKTQIFSEYFDIIKQSGDKWKYKRKYWGENQSLLINYDIHPDIKSIIEKIKQQSKTIGDYGDAIQGLTPYDKYKGHTPDIIKSRAFHHSEKIDDSCGKWLNGKNVGRYVLTEGDEWLQYGDWLASPREKKFFEGPRLLFREVPGSNRRIQATYADQTLYYGHSITPFLITNGNGPNHLFPILGVSNSKLISWFAKFTLANFAKKTFPKLNPKDIKNLPIPKTLINSGNNNIEIKVEKILSEYIKLNSAIENFHKYLLSKFSIKKLSKKLQNWQELEFGEFIKELNKAINTTNRERRKNEEPELPKLTKKDEFEWMDLFEENKKKALDLQQQIDKTDREIDQMVYELYGLTEEEIRIVEEAV